MKIRTVQWNIGGGKIRKPQDNPTDNYNYCNEGIDYVIDKLLSFNPDILTLQETHANNKKNQAELIAKFLNINYFVNFVYDKSHLEKGQGLGEAIISKFPLKSPQFDFFYNPKYQAINPKGESSVSHNKGITKSVAGINNTNLLIQTLHLIPFHRFGVDPYSKDANPVREDIIKKVDTKFKKFILSGDFNIFEPTISNFLPQLIKPLIKEVHLDNPTSPKGRFYDHVIYKGIEHINSKVLTNVLTDHYPIYSEFEI